MIFYSLSKSNPIMKRTARQEDVKSSHLFVSVDNVDILPVYSAGGLAWPGLSSAVEKNLSNSDLDIKNTKFFFDVKV